MVDESKIVEFHKKLITFLSEDTKSRHAQSAEEQIIMKDIHVAYDITTIIFTSMEQPHIDLTVRLRNKWEA